MRKKLHGPLTVLIFITVVGIVIGFYFYPNIALMVTTLSAINIVLTFLAWASHEGAKFLLNLKDEKNEK